MSLSNTLRYMSEISQAPKENPILSLAINVILPVLILNKLSVKIGPINALMLGLALPLLYGAYDFFKKKHWNWISILGFLNVAVTGGLALTGLSGIWFSIKEAFFPLLIGLFVIFSAFTAKPFVQTLLLNPQLMKLDLIDAKLAEKNSLDLFRIHLRNSTLLLAASFFLSAILNFVLAQRIFLPLDSMADAEAKAIQLNQQIAEMTSYSTIVIMVPSMIFLIFILWYLLSGIRKITGLKTEDFLKG
jgi:hypothetical protein